MFISKSTSKLFLMKFILNILLHKYIDPNKVKIFNANFYSSGFFFSFITSSTTQIFSRTLYSKLPYVCVSKPPPPATPRARSAVWRPLPYKYELNGPPVPYVGLVFNIICDVSSFCDTQTKKKSYLSRRNSGISYELILIFNNL